ncbi:DUF192 domain-containing protein [Candidatus Riflebacteria bacterium]
MLKYQIFCYLFLLLLPILTGCGPSDSVLESEEDLIESGAQAEQISTTEETKKVCFKEFCFKVEIADSQDEWQQGLMFRESLASNAGMLFIFEGEDFYSFHMKNTLIPLDIIWLNKDRKVVYIVENAEPGSLKSLVPDTKALYVLEINGGKSSQMGLKQNDTFIFSD